MRELLGAYDPTNHQTNALLKKLFLDKLPPQARSILAENLDTNLNILAIQADEILLALNDTNNSFTSSQKLINEIFDQRLNKLTSLLEKKPTNPPSSQNESRTPSLLQQRGPPMRQSFSHQKPSPRFRSQQPYRYQGNNSFSRNGAVMALKITILKTVLRNTTLTLDLTLDFATITIDLAKEQDAVNALARGGKI